MKSVIATTLALSLFMFSCKDEKKAGESVQQPEAPKTVTVTVNAVVDKDDTFQIFYNEDGTDKFAAEDAVTVQIKGSSQPQDVVFAMPQDVFPMAFRFDIGANQELKQVAFNSFAVAYKDKSFTVKKADFFKYFFPTESVKTDTINAVAKMQALEGAPYDPILLSTPQMNTELTNLFK